MRQAISIGLAILVLSSASGLLRADESKQKAAKLDTQVRVTLDYLLYLPPGYDQQEKCPLMLFLHGAGERGSDLNLVKTHGPPKLIEHGKQFPFIVVSPQCPKDHTWQPIELTALLDDVVAKYKVDRDRIYLTGLSMGGFGTWALAGYSPNRFAAIIPICGGGEAFLAKRIAHIPVWVFHGAKDPGVPLRRSQEMVDALKKIGSQVNFTVYPDAGHDSWTATYNDPKVYEWLLQQKLQPHQSSGS
ncbi:MAG TPA: prolyl oligopeptidase family serine peptidase [Planctomycetaceae bacterium]|jgi:predicted peptidase|nr:prolyl oligopeptidase family serine peptidase [Planctomycetaceae bacterium]